jgi:hypothetical protein
VTEERHITGSRRTAIKMVRPRHGIAELVGRLHNGTHRGKGGAADQSVHGRIGLGTVCKAETSRMKNVLIESSGGKNYVFESRKTVYSQKNSRRNYYSFSSVN